MCITISDNLSGGGGATIRRCVVGGGGCNAGVGMLALILVAWFWGMRRRRKA